MSKLNDFFRTMRGEDLDDELLDDETFEEETPKKPAKKTEKKSKESKPSKPEPKPESKREPVSSQEALLKAYKYSSSDKVQADIQTALEGKPISDDLRRLMQVLVDNDSFRKLLLSQAEVKKPEPKPDEYDLDPVYTNKDGKVVADEVIEAMLKSGTALEDLGVSAELYRVSKKDGKQIGLASDEEYDKYFDDLYEASKK
ncbi:MAG: hypothetical protein Q4E70_00035 [Candidatus Saccharibacteria bacterium]|nr:hypothetical protein [Candidatus Saccharibacteria bacterium]